MYIALYTDTHTPPGTRHFSTDVSTITMSQLTGRAHSGPSRMTLKWIESDTPEQSVS